MPVATGGVKFEWAEAKHLSNREKYDLDFVSIQDMFDGRPLEAFDSLRGGETRTLSIGVLDGVAYAVVTTLRADRIRIISARRASSDERDEYRAVHG